MKIYLVGGAVRDALLGEPVREKDWVVVGADPKDMLKRGFKQVGKQFPVFIHPKTGEEYALARTERKIGYGYHGFEFDASPEVSIEEDLHRRDLTINAIAQDENGALVDPWGGQKDIAEHLLRHISDAFAEDPVRILRVARFAARFYRLGFEIAPETLVLMKQMVVDGEADYLVAERVWKETEKAFATDHPSIYLKTLLRVGALARIAPELDALLCRIAEMSEKNDVDMEERMFQAIDRVPKNMPEVMLAILAFYAYRNGIAMNTLGERWKLPSGCRWMLDAAARLDDRLKSVSDLSSEALLDLFEQADALRSRKRFDRFLIAYKQSDIDGAEIECDIDYMTRVLDALATIEFAPKLQGLSGKSAKERVRELRLDAINSL